MISLTDVAIIFATGYCLGLLSSSWVFRRFEDEALSSWWKLYSAMVSGYITLRFFDSCVELFLKQSDPKNSPPEVTTIENDNDSLEEVPRVHFDSTAEDTTDDLLASQPIDMTGSYKLVKNENYDGFLETQGIPRILTGIALKSRPIHRLTHVGDRITIKIEGIIETFQEYTVDGPSIETSIRGKPFCDRLTYLTKEDLVVRDKTEVDITTPEDTGDLVNHAGTDNLDRITTETSTCRRSTASIDDDHSEANTERKSKSKRNGIKFRKRFKKNEGSRSGRFFNTLVSTKTVKRQAQNLNDSDKNEGVSSVSASGNQKNDGYICGIVNTKRSLRENYTLTVQRHLRENGAKIYMTLHVVYDDSSKKSVLARQIFERISD